MQSLSQNKSQWQTYKQLELIPNSVSNPNNKVSKIKFGLDIAWKTLISLLVDELVDEEQKVEYIERCWKLNVGQSDNSSSSLQRLWVLMN